MPRATALSAIGVVLALFALGCSTEPVDDLSAETAAELYETGDDIVVTLTNDSDDNVSYRACPSIWERKTDGGYDRTEGLEVCSTEVTSVGAHSSVDLHYTFPGNELGTWRIVIPVGSDNPPDEIHTNDFQVVVF